MINNTGDWNTGSCNTGSWNTGDWNTGSWNTGNRTAGDWNTGNRNTGNRNAGDWNTGSWNTGDWNTGSWNTGSRNTGSWNTGNRNAGDWNTGSWNTGNRNTGNRNTGSWNTGNCNAGYCNTVTPEYVLVFNKPAKRKDWDDAKKPVWMYCDLTEWVSDSEMTDKEKEAYPSYVTTGGYLKVFTSLQHAYADSWEKATKEDRKLTLKLPNFDKEVFKEIFGFYPDVENKKTFNINGVDIELTEEDYNKIKESFEND